MAYTFRKDLFIADKGAAMMFNLEGCTDAIELTSYVEHGGGSIDQGSGPFTITLRDKNGLSNFPTLEHDVFLPKFIEMCCTRNKILQLKNYRCNSKSVLSDEFDPNDVLLRKLNWKEAIQRYGSVSNDTRDSSSGSSVSSNMQSTFSHALRSKRGTLVRCEFTQGERASIVNFIVQVKGFNDVKGTALWKRMSRKFPNHTWQSLKQHFHKKILPVIEHYKLAPEVLKCFKTAVFVERMRNSSSKSYSEKEDLSILKYVEKHGKKLGGNVFWQQLESQGVIPGRTWQSLRERFTKHLRNKKSSDFTNTTGEFNLPSVEDRSLRVRKATTSAASQLDLKSSDTDEDIDFIVKQSSRCVRKFSSSSSLSDLETCEEAHVKESVEKKEKDGKKVRKLFTPSYMLSTPPKDDATHTPISVNRKGTSMLDILIRKRDEQSKTKLRKKLSVLKRKQGEKSSDSDENNKSSDPSEMTDFQSEPEVQYSIKKPQITGAVKKLTSAPVELVAENQNSDEELHGSQDLLDSCEQDSVQPRLEDKCGNSSQLDSASQVQEKLNLSEPPRACNSSTVELYSVDVSDHEDALSVDTIQQTLENPVSENDEDYVSDWSEDGLFFAGATYEDSDSLEENHAKSESKQHVKSSEPSVASMSLMKASIVIQPPVISSDQAVANVPVNSRKEQHCKSDTSLTDQPQHLIQPLGEAVNETYNFFSDFTPVNLNACIDSSTQHKSEFHAAGSEAIDYANRYQDTDPSSSSKVDVGTHVRFYVDVAVQTDPVMISYPKDTTVLPSKNSASLSDKRSASDALLVSPKTKRVSFAPQVRIDHSPVRACLHSAEVPPTVTYTSSCSSSPLSPKYPDVPRS